MQTTAIVLCALLLLFGCTGEKRPQTGVEDMKEYSLQEYVHKNQDSVERNLEVMFEGNEIATPQGNKKCVYYQIVDYAGYNDQSYGLGNKKVSSQSFIMNVGDAKVEVEPESTVRLFLPATVVKEEKIENGNMQTRLYCLEKGKKYYVRIEPQTIEYGPPQDDGTRMSSEYIFVKISDVPFVDNTPQREESPVFRDMIYS